MNTLALGMCKSFFNDIAARQEQSFPNLISKQDFSEFRKSISTSDLLLPLGNFIGNTEFRIELAYAKKTD
jgi:hypothetical protein